MDLNLSLEEKLREIARLEKKLEKRKKRKGLNDKIKTDSKLEDKNEREGVETQIVDSVKSRVFRKKTVNFDHEDTFFQNSTEPKNGSNLFDESIIPASQSPTFKPSLTQRKRRSKRKSINSLVKQDGDGLAHLKTKDVNQLPVLRDEDMSENDDKLILPQPNFEMIVTVSDFTLPKEFTGLKLESKRNRDLLSYDSNIDTSFSQRYKKKRKLNLDDYVPKSELTTVILSQNLNVSQSSTENPLRNCSLYSTQTEKSVETHSNKGLNHDGEEISEKTGFLKDKSEVGLIAQVDERNVTSLGISCDANKEPVLTSPCLPINYKDEVKMDSQLPVDANKESVMTNPCLQINYKDKDKMDSQLPVSSNNLVATTKKDQLLGDVLDSCTSQDNASGKCEETPFLSRVDSFSSVDIGNWSKFETQQLAVEEEKCCYILNEYSNLELTSDRMKIVLCRNETYITLISTQREIRSLKCLCLANEGFIISYLLKGAEKSQIHYIEKSGENKFQHRYLGTVEGNVSKLSELKKPFRFYVETEEQFSFVWTDLQYKRFRWKLRAPLFQVLREKTNL